MLTSTVNRSLRRKSDKGMTLIELMVVVIIVGILAAMILINYPHAKSNATVATSQANLKEIATALEVYNGDNGAYPAAKTAVAIAPGVFGANSSKYLPTTPTSPGNGGSYMYQTDGTGEYYSITDPATYESASLANLPKAAQAPANGVLAAAPGAKCGVGGTCTHIGYTNQNNLFGY
jgi:general secretion pathway protein G